MNKSLTKCQECSHAKWFGGTCKVCSGRLQRPLRFERKNGEIVRSCDKCGRVTFRKNDVPHVVCYWCSKDKADGYGIAEERKERDRFIYETYKNNNSITFADIAEFPDINLGESGVYAAHRRYKRRLF